jgi:hypothetical protein
VKYKGWGSTTCAAPSYLIILALKYARETRSSRVPPCSLGSECFYFILKAVAQVSISVFPQHTEAVKQMKDAHVEQVIFSAEPVRAQPIHALHTLRSGVTPSVT